MESVSSTKDSVWAKLVGREENKDIDTDVDRLVMQAKRIVFSKFYPFEIIDSENIGRSIIGRQKSEIIEFLITSKIATGKLNICV